MNSEPPNQPHAGKTENIIEPNASIVVSDVSRTALPVLEKIVLNLPTPSYRQRIYSAKSIAIVKKSFYLSALAYGIFSILPVIVGLSAFSINPDLQNQNMAFPFMATVVLPPMMGALVLISGLSATMSSGDSDTITGVTILLRDVWVVFTGKVPEKTNVIKYSRWAIFLNILLAFLFGVLSQDILDYITKMSSTLMAGLSVTVILGKFWQRATWQGAIAALVAGSLVSFIILSVPSVVDFWGNPILPALTAAFLAHVVTSLITPRKRLTDMQALELINTERRAMDI